MSKARLQANYASWARTGPILESLTEDELLVGASQAEQHLLILNPKVKELLKLISRIVLQLLGLMRKSHINLSN
jgi:hypothetical protein